MSTPESASQFQMALLPGIHDAQVAQGSVTGVAETAMGGSVSMRTSKVLAGSALAIAAAMQIGMGGMASASDGDTLGIAAAAVDDNGDLKVDILYSCPKESTHKSLSVYATEVDKDGKTVAEGRGTGKLVVTDYDTEKKENVEKPGCDGAQQRLTVTLKKDEDMPWVKGGMGTVKVAFTNDVEFSANQSNLKFINY
ncbi:hypothetical protein ACFWF7_22155 [Nocardia sp. NPDC060256]|uniref:hypothetical protein n=1 Tax=unclassified Nocardia TaxID=2637762 RepID=UPI00364F7C94